MTMLMTERTASDETHVLARALCAALAFEPFTATGKKKLTDSPNRKKQHDPHVHAHTLMKGYVTPNLSDVSLEDDDDDDEFFDAVEFHDSDPDNELHLAFSRSRSSSPSVEMIRGGASTPIPLTAESSPVSSPSAALYDAPPPPTETPERFIRAGKGDPVLGRHRYEETLKWRAQHGMNTILKEPHHEFELIKKHYPHYFHLQGKNGEFCYYEFPPQTNLKALREGGVTLDSLLKHYAMVTEFHWQVLDRNDYGKSIYIIDLKGIRISDFVGECVDFVRKASHFTGQHYPERAGYVFVVNVPSWFKIIWNVVRPMVDPVTFEKIYIVRGKGEILEALSERIPIENIPPEYGGTSVPLGQAEQEKHLWDLVNHNNEVDLGHSCCSHCQYCTFRYARSY